MKPLASFDASAIGGVFTDIDDTLTTDGQLTDAAYAALCDLARAGLAVVPVTGRSAGWAHMIVKTWPVRAVVAESGGLMLWRDPRTGLLLRRFHDEQLVMSTRSSLAACAQQVVQAIPGLAAASDNFFRLVDLALDYCEEVPAVDPAQVARAIDMFRGAGFSARASSVHINAWAGDFDKGPMALRCLTEVFGGTALAELDAWAFIGDAPNDASMFGLFPHSVGVANIIDVVDQLPTAPAYVTSGRSGTGFIEFAEHLMAARRPRSHNND